MAKPSTQSIIDALFAIAPEFYTVDSTVLSRYETLITLLRGQVNTAVLSCNATLAFAYLLAHQLALPSNSGGVVSSLSEGELSINYAVDSESTALQLTQYGRMYRDLIKRTVVAPFVTGTQNCGTLAALYGYGKFPCC